MSAPRPSTIGTVDALARLQLAMRRLGLELRLRDASRELLELLDLAGLTEVLGLEPGWEPEKRKERLGVEEEREFDNAAG